MLRSIAIAMALLNSSTKKKGRLDALEKRLSIIQSSESPSPIRPAFAPSQDAQGTDATYSKLCDSVLNGPLRANLQLRPVGDTGAEVHALLTNLLEANTKFEGDVGSTIESRMQDAVLLLDSRPTQGGTTERARRNGRLGRGKRSTKCLSLRQHRHLGSYDLPQHATKHDVYHDLQEMWISYAEGLLANCRSNEAMMHSRLLTADLHGAILAVVDSKNPTFIGTQGIMVRETAKTFGLITSKDKFAVIPKAGSTFRLKVKNITVTLFGSGLSLRDPTSFSQTKNSVLA